MCEPRVGLGLILILAPWAEPHAHDARQHLLCLHGLGEAQAVQQLPRARLRRPRIQALQPAAPPPVLTDLRWRGSGLALASTALTCCASRIARPVPL